MGAVCSSEEIRKQAVVNKEIENVMEKDKKTERAQHKLLLLGTAECGKSTILKQIQILHANGFTESEYEERERIIYSNTLSSMVTILSALERLQLDLDAHLQPDVRLVRNASERGDDQPLSSELATAVKTLWLNNTIQKAYQRRNEYQLSDSAKYFLDSIDRISAKDYKPTEVDILHTRVPTTGVVELQFVIKKNTFRTFDVGGQRSERRKWIHLFDDVNAIIYISAINEYDQVLLEDGKTNRLLESMLLFKQILNSQWFTKTSIVLFLNKTDLFKEKVTQSSIKKLFTNYAGPDIYDATVTFIAKQFESLKEAQTAKEIYVHETCATQTNQVQLVIDSVVDALLQKAMGSTGIL